MNGVVTLKTINIGILAHVDAGKTSITENILYEANVLKVMGSVDDGNTKTDSMELEKKRGITIKSSPVSFSYKDIKVNLIDTPGILNYFRSFLFLKFSRVSDFISRVDILVR